MTFTAWRFSLFRALKINRGEESRVLSFFLLHVVLSVVIGMISTVVDPLIITRRTTGDAVTMYAVSAIVLGCIGLFYAGITDRVDKRRLFALALVVSILICVAAGMLLFLRDLHGEVPFLVSGLFIWRFVVGILLLLIFWDLAPFYFDARQGKRLFPLLAMGGALGYSGGSLAVVPLARALPLGLQLFTIALVTLVCLGGFQVTRKRFRILDAPRYRDKTIQEELQEGLAAFRGNYFLRAVGWNTVIFGVLAGLIILTYNAVIDARTTTGTEAASLMGYQRAVATLLQAVVLTKVMSQSQLGGRHKNAVVLQLVFFTVGIVAFAISMVGVADFTRQIEVALMSPAAMAAFAFLPSRYRGRVMVLNNIVAASLGILGATLLVLTVGRFVDPLWFIYPIAALMVLRLAFNFVLNRRYVALLSESILADNRLNLARIEENTGSILQDDTLLQRLFRETREQTRSIRVFVTGRLARSATTPEDVEKIRPFFEWDHSEDDESLQALWIQTLARIDYDRFRESILQAKSSPYGSVRLVARLASLRTRITREGARALEEETERLREEFTRAARDGTDQEFRETCDLILSLERFTNTRILAPFREPLPPRRDPIFLQAVADNPGAPYFRLLAEGLITEETRSIALTGLRNSPESLLLEHRDLFSSLSISDRLHVLQDMEQSHPEFVRRESVDLLTALLAHPRDESGREESDRTRGFLRRYARLHRTGESLIDAGILILTEPTAVSPGITRAIRDNLDDFSWLFPHLFILRYDTPTIGTSRYAPLLYKLVDEMLQTLAVLILTLTAMTFSKEEDRVLAASICRELRDRTSLIQQNALEFMETRFDGDVRKYLLLVFESLTPDEKRARLKPIVKNLSLDGTSVMRSLLEYYRATDEPILAEILDSVV